MVKKKTYIYGGILLIIIALWCAVSLVGTSYARSTRDTMILNTVPKRTAAESNYLSEPSDSLTVNVGEIGMDGETLSFWIRPAGNRGRLSWKVRLAEDSGADGVTENTVNASEYLTIRATVGEDEKEIVNGEMLVLAEAQDAWEVEMAWVPAEISHRVCNLEVTLFWDEPEGDGESNSVDVVNTADLTDMAAAKEKSKLWAAFHVTLPEIIIEETPVEEPSSEEVVPNETESSGTDETQESPVGNEEEPTENVVTGSGETTAAAPESEMTLAPETEESEQETTTAPETEESEQETTTASETKEPEQETTIAPETEESEQETTTTPETEESEQETTTVPETEESEQETTTVPETEESEQETTMASETGESEQETTTAPETDPSSESEETKEADTEEDGETEPVIQLMSVSGLDKKDGYPIYVILAEAADSFQLGLAEITEVIRTIPADTEEEKAEGIEGESQEETQVVETIVELVPLPAGTRYRMDGDDRWHMLYAESVIECEDVAEFAVTVDRTELPEIFGETEVIAADSGEAAAVADGTKTEENEKTGPVKVLLVTLDLTYIQGDIDTSEDEANLPEDNTVSPENKELFTLTAWTAVEEKNFHAETVIEEKFITLSRCTALEQTAVDPEQARVLSRDSWLRWDFPLNWKEYDLEYTVEHQTEEGWVKLEDLSAMGFAMTETDPQVDDHAWTLRLEGDVLAQAGTYRIHFKWNYAGHCFYETETTFFVNYMTGTQSWLRWEEAPNGND